MVTKCSNPTCARPFHYLHEGRLFRLEPDAAVHADTDSDSASVEYFWLCDSCSKSMTLRLSERGEVTVAMLADDGRAGDHAHAVISQHNGLLLRSVTMDARDDSLRPRKGRRLTG